MASRGRSPEVASAPEDKATASTETISKQFRAPANRQQSLIGQQAGVSSSSSSNNQPPCETVSFHLKSGIFTRLVTIDSDKMALGIVKQLAIAFLNEIYFQHSYPSQSYIGDYLRKHFATSDSLGNLYERIILRLYNPAQDSFTPFSSVSDIQPDSYISIEISERQLEHQQQQQQQQQVLGAVVVSSGDGNQLTSSSFDADPTTGITQGLLHSHSRALSSSSSNYQLKISHDFHSTTYIKPTYCASCNTLILGVYKQGFQCQHCKRNYCPKCKNKANLSGEGCVAPALGPSTSFSSSAATSSSLMASHLLLSPKQQQQQQPAGPPQSPSRHQLATACHQQQPVVSDSGADSGASSSDSSSMSPSLQVLVANGANASVAGQQQPNSKSEKLDLSQHANMSKRKSASNLLHFNIANPFKSHHNNNIASGQTSHANSQTKDESPAHIRAPSMKSMRGSAGALEPILHQLSKQMRDNQQQQQQQQHQNQRQSQNKSVAAEAGQQAKSGATSGDSTRLLNVQTTQLSSSHQNLHTFQGERERDNPSPGVGCGSSSAHQSPSKLTNSVRQLSNSARNSARDISQAHSPTRRDQVSNHSFIGMDWIQLYGEPLCGVCNKSLKTKQQQQMSLAMCKTCKLQVHSQCQDLALADCLSRITESSRAAAERADSSARGEEGHAGTTATAAKSGDQQLVEGAKSALRSTNSNVSRDNIRLHRLGQSVKHTKRPDLTKPIIEGWLQHKTLSDEQPRRHYWRLDETDITLYESDTSPRYFKAIALSKITRVISASSLPKQIKEDVALGCSPTNGRLEQQQQQGQTKSANTSPLKTSEFRAQMESMFAFEVTTGSVYLVQACDQVEASRWKGSLEAITARKRTDAAARVATETQTEACEQKQRDEKSGQQGALVALAHQHQFRPQQSDGAKANEQQQQQQHEQKRESRQRDLINLADGPGDELLDKQKAGARGPHDHHPHHHHQHHHHHLAHDSPASGLHKQRNQLRTHTDPNRSRLYNRPRKVIQLDPMSIPDHWIEGKYLIERNRSKGVGFEELGSGQFGKVFAAISEIKAEDPSKGLWSGVPVAIKEISKARFDLRQQAKLKNEANILSRLDHPGVIILERVHDLPDKLYIVMEQLEDDMLEMIVSTEEKRLNERVTKFLTYQILEALKYLHSQNIAHCDLKPENVLLCEQRSQFPQVKLCDFGFAKIIEENSFRCSLVGTPAYLAPEVVKGERYNRSVDLWSVGVIVYVSLSGEFPFNEGENIHDQISRANFMYPDQPWARISAQAKSFINSLLRVNSDKRLSASRAQMDAWLQDYQLWCDLCELELRLGRRWVTDDADFSRWSQYAKQRQLQVPRAAVQLHQELASGGED